MTFYTLRNYALRNIFLRSIYTFSIFYSASSHTSSKPRFIPHILMRRHVLTLTVYKFLDIEIIVELTSHVEIAISRQSRQLHNPASYYVESVHRETCRY